VREYSCSGLLELLKLIVSIVTALGSAVLAFFLVVVVVVVVVAAAGCCCCCYVSRD
jgi:hypothetical protein